MKSLYPTKIIYAENVENANFLLKQKAFQIGLFEKDLAVFKKNSFVILDYGKEISGSCRILTFKGKGKFRIRFGESVTETMADIGYKNATNDHSVRDMMVDVENYSDMTFGQSGFRFIRVDNLTDNDISIKSILASDSTDDREQTGYFLSDDKLVNQIFDTASYTIRMCLQNGYFWDGVKRDRLVWIGDLYPEMRACHCIFGDQPETLNSLDFAYSETPLPLWMAGIPAYSLWWLIILSDEYKVNGNKKNFTKYIDYILDLIKQVSEFVTCDGETTYPFNFIDWPTQYQEGEPQQKLIENKAGMAYLTKIAMMKISEFLTDFGYDDSLCKDIIKRIDNKKWHIESYKQIASLAVLSGDKSKDNQKILLNGGAKGLSTFMSYPILTALASYGNYNEALNIMKDYYGGMLSVGATTFWEDFDIDWLKDANRIDEMPDENKKDIHGDYGAFCYKGFRHSFCHGWSAGVIAYLFETVAGLNFKKNMTELEVRPHLSGLKHIKVNCPTRFGVVSVEHTSTKQGNIETKITAPNEIKVKKFIK